MQRLKPIDAARSPMLIPSLTTTTSYLRLVADTYCHVQHHERHHRRYLSGRKCSGKYWKSFLEKKAQTFFCIVRAYHSLRIHTFMWPTHYIFSINIRQIYITFDAFKTRSQPINVTSHRPASTLLHLPSTCTITVMLPRRTTAQGTVGFTDGTKTSHES